ncbi:aminotransferase class I/II-fold pyridoxal phosphate-dependent enzyme [Paenibacillus kandeliae]|uniref:aminotransferase class I/II-fold pyridoxal phosphate-dependent enzyme n=1 Tax=Paenibacillus kandeliae TaxID=3231269 RepID=UPI00345913AB
MKERSESNKDSYIEDMQKDTGVREDVKIEDHSNPHVSRIRAPLYERLVQYAQSGQRSYHVPGHKNGGAYFAESFDPQKKAVSDLGHDIPLKAESGFEWDTELYLNTETNVNVDVHLNTTLDNDAEWNMEYLRNVFQIDVTEIEGTDDLHHPEGVIREGQELAARCFGAEETHWLVGGSTVGNLAMLLTVCTHPGELVLVQRNVHKSVIHGMMMAGAQAVFLTPELDMQSGLAVIPSTESIEQALQTYPQARAVLLTSPNYYGMGRDLTDIAKLCHEYHMPLLIDEAHGAHYGHHPRFPQSALSAGADAVVQSTHKMLSAMTMGAMLHVQGNLLNRNLLKQRLTMLQSSSPSYPLMASLDLSRYVLETKGAALFEKGLAARDALVVGVQQIHFVVQNEDEASFTMATVGEHSRVQGSDDAMDSVPSVQAAGTSGETKDIDARLARFGVLYETNKRRISEAVPTVEKGMQQRMDVSGCDWQIDPFKVVLYDRTGMWSGSELQERLQQYGCIPEMSDERYVVLVFSLGSRMKDADVLLDALRDLAVNNSVNLTAAWTAYNEDEVDSQDPVSGRTQLVQDRTEVEKNKITSTEESHLPMVSLKHTGLHGTIDIELISEPVAFHMIPVMPEDVESIVLEAAAGRICAEMIIPYPPGIPILYPGERIGESMHTRLLGLRDHNIKIQGAEDASLRYIKVYC